MNNEREANVTDTEAKLTEDVVALSNDVGINALVKMAHQNSRAHGWYDGGERNVPEMLCLIHSEISEALEELRKNPDARHTYDGEGGKPEGFQFEIADAVIRIADLCGYLGINLAGAVSRKHFFNATRPYRHGGKAL